MITLRDYLPQEPNELFFRLNQSYNLTPPEKRNALHGEARDQVKQLVSELTESGLLDSRKIGFSNGRLAYDDIIARTCVAIQLGNLRVHINNGVVEDYYRSQPFSNETVDNVRRSAYQLMRQIEEVPDRVKFNKGTLQSWLLYCHWAGAESGALPIPLLGDFEHDRSVVRRGERADGNRVTPAIAEVLRLYDDRASYRVTDVSSVLIRDLAVHLYSVSAFGMPARRHSDELLVELEHDPSASQTLIGEFLDSVQWGTSLMLREARP